MASASRVDEGTIQREMLLANEKFRVNPIIYKENGSDTSPPKKIVFENARGGYGPDPADTQDERHPDGPEIGEKEA